MNNLGFYIFGLLWEI